jgi:hypothetical protein
MTDKTRYQILTEAQALIRDESHWTRGAYARDAAGVAVGAHHPRATCWCGEGAIIKCGGGERFGGLRPDFQALLRGEPSRMVYTNDDKGHAAVIALFDRLREKAMALVQVSAA